MKRWVTLFFVAFCSLVFCSERFEQPVVEQIVHYDDHVCLLVDQHWLLTDGFEVLPEGSFALIQGAWLPLEEAVVVGAYEVSWRCRKCNRFNMDGVNTCPYCGTPKRQRW